MKSLEEIDSIYKTTISKLPTEEKIEYYKNLIDKTQLNLMRNKGYINKTLEDQLCLLIVAAQAELLKLTNE